MSDGRGFHEYPSASGDPCHGGLLNLTNKKARKILGKVRNVEYGKTVESEPEIEELKEMIKEGDQVRHQ